MFMRSKKKKMRKSKRTSKMQKFAREEMERYVKIHKENEKELSYIG